MIVSYYDCVLSVPTIFSICAILLALLTLNVNSSYTTDTTVKISNMSTSRIHYNSIALRFGAVIFALLALWLFIFKAESGYFWFGHLFYSNLYLFFLTVAITTGLILVIIFQSNFNGLKNVRFDYYFITIVLTIIIPWIFFVTNLLAFFFFIEVISNLVLYQFVVGTDSSVRKVKRNTFFNYKTSTKSSTHSNVIFFHYWTSFFSSVLLVYITLIWLINYSTTEFTIINILNFIDTSSGVFKINMLATLVLFVVAFILKLGLAPVHFYKIEIYKGLPFITILLYTFFYFIFFFLFFTILISIHLSSGVIIWWGLCALIISSGLIFVSFLLFDTTAIKAFFAYSTIVNSLGFLILVISMLS